jgi:WD40 repeat protein
LPGRIFAARYSADGGRVVVGSSSDGRGEVRVYQAGGSVKPDIRLLCLSGLPTVSGKGILPLFFLFDPRSGHLVSTLEGQRGAVYAVAYRPDGLQVASAGFDGVVRLNDPDTGKLLKELVAVPPASGSGVVTSKGP